MSYTIRWDRKAKGFLKKLDRTTAKRIIKKINSIVDDPRHHLKFLIDIEGYKLRIGDYRVLIDLNESERVIDVLLIDHRKNVYKYLRRMRFRAKTYS